MGLCGQRHAQIAVTPGNISGTPCAGGWIGPRVGLDGCRKYRLTPGFDPRTVHVVA
jgi:hypothetical protein